MKNQIIINTAIREAFINAKVRKESKLTATILNVLSTKAGTRLFGRGWSFNVSGKTHRNLTNEGILA